MDYFKNLKPGQGVHRRFNELINKHVLVSPHRTKRPWKGQVEDPIVSDLPSYDKACYLCPGNERAGGYTNPRYDSVFTFDNDYPALLPPTAEDVEQIGEDHSGQQVYGRCKVMCFHPRHDVTLARMAHDDIVKVIRGWQEVYEQEGEAIRAMQKELNGPDEGYVQIFENRGAMMGCSAPHPHGQVWSMTYVPDEPHTEITRFSEHLKKHNAHLLLSYAQFEYENKERVVAVDEESGWIAVVPFWATWPYELLVMQYKRHIPSLLQCSEAERDGLARILKEVLVRYDNLFSCPFPYSMGLHQSPLPPLNPEADPAEVHFHFYPPLLRSASVRKFMVGFEMLGEVQLTALQRDVTPEQSAAKLRDVSSRHYTESVNGVSDIDGANGVNGANGVHMRAGANGVNGISTATGGHCANGVNGLPKANGVNGVAH
ncbi:putative UTP-hexose-1-phosphate uridylyltransferase [Papiliotrema laurentii]|uniref:Galactose-1-phosphate uridylyltransferase n=1 Tax=Papiliotrema laurentii TaxID=5418 RepID=A0AAD9L766_PAPLA|nr:putative UTP-hexose-1-phosphate uridylyltransferase [Papiliotrema laurentii]